MRRRRERIVGTACVPPNRKKSLSGEYNTPRPAEERNMIPLCVVDAFTDRPFAGNPAAVCVLERWPSNELLQLVAREMNLSETAFLVRCGDGEFELRWFTPKVEVALCGHATLASAHALWENGHAPRARLTFDTASGPLTATPLPSGEIELDFPARPAARTDPPAGLLDALGTAA